jgi:hypothetical protein
MAPVIAAALISAAASMAKSQQDKRAAAGQTGEKNYQIDMNGGNNNGGMNIDTYQKPQTSGGGNNSGAMIDAAGDVIGKVVTSKMESSDERLKNIFGDNEDAIKVFADLDAIKFTYNDKAKEIPDSEGKGVDDDMHYGLKAQDLAKNPLTESAVKKDPLSDYLEVDTKELTMANTAIISEICKRILILEKVLGIKVV